MRLRSIRTRLTLWYFGILAVILVLFAAGVYVTMRRTLSSHLDDSLENRAFLIERLIAFDAGGAPRLDVSINENDPNLDDSFQRLFNADGTLVFDNSHVFGDAPIDEDAVRRALAGETISSTHRPGRLEARLRTQPVTRDGRIVGALQVGESTSDLRGTLRSLLIVSGIGLCVALLVSTAGGYLLARRALAPIDAVTSAANEISEQDLSRRLALDLPDDEVGRLAGTFDAMIERLDAAFQRQRQFTADASHELRTPLTAIRGQIDVALQRPREPGDYQAVLAIVNDQVERLSRLVAGLLIMARADAGRVTIERQRVDVADLVRSVAEQVRPLAAQKGLSLDTRGDDGIFVVGDEDLLLQLMLNLTDNAVKYTESGGVMLVWRLTSSGVAIDVRDTGMSIAEADRVRVFERFYRADAARSGDPGGAGLGLSISEWIAQLHGGGITLQSGADGSVFTVSLPAA